MFENSFIYFIGAALLGIFLALFSSCDHDPSTSATKKAYIDEPPHFMSVVDKTKDYTIYKHNETGVYYFSVDDDSAVVMINPDGSPYTEKGSH